MNKQSSEGSDGSSLPRIPKKKKFLPTGDPPPAAATTASAHINTNTDTPYNSAEGEGKHKGDEAPKATNDESPSKRKPGRPPGAKNKPKSPAAAQVSSPAKSSSGGFDDHTILRKGDLVRLSNE
jgi:hypothetical protein